MKTLKNFNFKNKRVLIRCDFNVPINEKGDILDDFRIQKALPTINYLTQKGAKIILMSHLDDPDGQVVDYLRLIKVKGALENLLGKTVFKTQDCVGQDVIEKTLAMKGEEIMLLENLRFHKEEEAGDLNFAKELSKLGDIYINEAFSACHRAHASISGVTKFLPSCVGLLLEAEIEYLNKILKNPKKPMVAIIGGKKVETKAKFINKISEICEWVLISGLIEKEIREKKIELRNPKKIIKPVDETGGGLDIGPQTIKLFREKIIEAETIVWNGPLGKIEEKEFRKGTEKIAKAIVDSKVFSIAGGGETVEFIKDLKLVDKFSHVSTGGGAMLAFLAGEKMPGIEALK
jgi:phosphoglycerate kinase